MLENLLHKNPTTPAHTQHNFVLIAKTIGKPHQTFNLPSAHQVTISPQAVLGTTTFLYECSECGQKNIVELLGQEETDQIQELVQDVVKYGQAKFVFENRSYAVLLDTTTPPPPTTIPVRMPLG